MRYQGRLENWNDEKGYGFVKSIGSGTKAFVHIKSFTNRRRRPVEGELITYEIITDEMNRSKAHNIKYATESDPLPSNTKFINTGKSYSGLIFSTLFIVFILALSIFGKIPVQLLFLYIISSCIVFIVYAFDKSAAMNNRWRTKESTLHFLALIGGWPGAIYAQKIFRHKSRKIEFQIVFWIIVFINCGVLSWTLTEKGSEFVDIITRGL